MYVFFKGLRVIIHVIMYMRMGSKQSDVLSTYHRFVQFMMKPTEKANTRNKECGEVFAEHFGKQETTIV